MQPNNIYTEKIFSKGMTAMLAFITAVFLFSSYYQLFVEPIGKKPAPDWLFPIMFSLFLGITINFRWLIITITPESVSVGFGIFTKKILYENIDGCNLDDRSNIRYGGLGIRTAKVEGKWVLVYNVIRCPKVVLSLKMGRFKEFVFSTKNPEEIIKIVKQQILR